MYKLFAGMRNAHVYMMKTGKIKLQKEKTLCVLQKAFQILL